MTRSSLLLKFAFLLLVGLLSACGGMGVKKGPEPQAEGLSSNAQDTYHYLLLEDARRSQNSTVGEYAIDQLLENSPSPMVFLESANFLWHQGELDKAQQVLQEGLKKHPNNQQMELMLAQLFLAAKDPDRAAEAIENYLKGNPDDIMTRQELADILIRNEEYQRAYNILDQIPSAKRTSSVLFYMSKALAGLDQRDKAIKQLQVLLAKDPDLIEAWAELAYLYELEHDYAAAEKAYNKILKMGETSQELWLRLIDLNLRLNRPQKALLFTQQGPKELSFMLGAGTLFVDQGYYDYAEKIFIPLLKKNPKAQEIYFYLALLEYKGKKDSDRAIELLQKIPESNNYYDRALRFMAHLRFDAGQEDQSHTLMEKGRALFPEQKEFYTLDASFFEEENNLKRAKELLDIAAAMWPDDTDIRFQQGVLLDKSGKKKQALQLMEEIASSDPENAEALNYIGYTLAEEKRDLQRAHDLISRALALKPDNGYIRDSLAWLYYHMGKLDLAFREIKQAVLTADSDPIIWEHYGDIAAKLGNKPEAQKGYTNALKFEAKDKDAIRKKLQAL